MHSGIPVAYDPGSGSSAWMPRGSPPVYLSHLRVELSNGDFAMWSERRPI
jgi:hypothetical protein